MGNAHSGRLLYLIRHGEAKSKGDDPARPLTASGAADVARMATWAAGVGVSVSGIRHSGKLRARQTAEIFADCLSVSAPRAVSGLAPNDDVAPFAESLHGETGSIMLVGHLPFLERLAALLVTGNAECGLVNLEASALLTLACHEDVWTMACLMQPRLLPQQSGP